MQTSVTSTDHITAVGGTVIVFIPKKQVSKGGIVLFSKESLIDSSPEPKVSSNGSGSDCSRERLTRAKAIRAKCLDCSCYQPKEVRLCPVVDCALWPYRFGRGYEVPPDRPEEVAVRYAAGANCRESVGNRHVFEGKAERGLTLHAGVANREKRQD